MNIVAELMYDREKLRAKIKKWKWLFFIALIILIFALSKNSKKIEHDHIARISIEGMILHDPYLIEDLKELEKDPKVKALIVHIDSPGGTTFAGEEIYETLKKVKAKKPVVSVLETTAASGGYMVALATDHIVARNMTLTGSIGVLSQSFEAVELAKKLGIKLESFKSSPLKAAPNPMEVTTPEAKAATMESIQDSYDIFLKMLIESRKMSKEQALKVANGKAYTGKRAKELKLIDEIGGEEEAIAWLEKNKKIPKDMPIQDANWGEKESFFEEFTKFLHNSNSIFKQTMNSRESIMAIK
jgi:protease-4